MDKKLTLERLQIFARAAEAPSFRAAAEQMGITEPKVSECITVLDQCLGVKLFERRQGIKARITAAGRAFLPYVKKLLQDAEDLQEFVHNWEEGNVRTTIPIACYPAHLERFLGSVIKQFLQEHPRVHIDLRVREDRRRYIIRTLFEELEAGEVDLAFGPWQRHQGLDGIKAYEAKIRLLLPDSHGMRYAGQAPLEILKELPVLIAPRDHYSRDKVDKACREAGFRLRPEGESASPSALYVLGNAGVGVPVLPDDYSLVNVDGGEYPVLLDVDGNELSTAVWLHWRREDRPPLVTAFIDCAKRWADADLRTPRIAAISYGKNKE